MRHRPSTFLFAACLAAVLRGQATTVASPLPAGDGWRAEQIHKSDGGVWYAHVDKVVDAFGANEVIAGDDKGRLLVLSVYSGQWTAHSVVCDGLWLAPTRSADVDPRVPGREIYAGGRAGSVHRISLRPQPFARFTLESVEIGHAAGEEFHAVVAGDFVPGGQQELLAFGISGAVFQLVPAGQGDGFTMRRVATVSGRVRDVAAVQAPGQSAPLLYGVSRSGDLLAMRLGADGLQHELVVHEDCGLGASPRRRGGRACSTRRATTASSCAWRATATARSCARWSSSVARGCAASPRGGSSPTTARRSPSTATTSSCT